ncbi:MAG: efflux RND transporter periplasmic adaptor subunit [Deltaproteobacteria bacterium]|nr:efflux RND transporter periplasmic adaptor subunit [Deltaproteobacteria bacterium]
MKRAMTSIIFLLIGITAGVAVMWVYSKPSKPPGLRPSVKTERKVLYYRHPMDPKVTSPAPMKDNMGMDYIPVYEDEAPRKTEHKVLYYRHPMNPQVTSPTPQKDEMGMDYIPVYEDEAAAKEAPGTVRISPEKIQKIGVRSEEVKRRALKRIIRTVGRVEPVEDKVYVINAKVSGWVEKLYVNKTDQMIHPGEPLLALYSPDLVSAQEEYLLAYGNTEKMKDSPYPEVKKGAESLLNAARQRLRNWDISDDQIKRLEETGKITHTMVISAPAHGGITEKMIVQGQKIEAGEPLFRIIDHSMVWVYGEIYEYETPYIKLGQEARLSPSYTPSEVYKGKIEHIYAHLGSIRYVPEQGTEIRTVKVRFELPNKDHKLKLGMYLNVEISVNVAKNDIAVPDSALLDTGTRQVVIIDRRDGTFEPREVKIGANADNYYEILQGVKAGEWVVTSANFLIDSESNLKAALGGMTAHGHGNTKKEEPVPVKEEQRAGHEGH